MPEPNEPSMMTCMEVWGGNQSTERSFSTLGLETWLYSKPYQQADGGGDVYYVSSCATGRITRLLVADVSGHGSSVAEIASRLRSLMRRHVNHIEQTRFVAQMNAEFSTLRHSGGFATAVAATFFAPTRRLTITNAGHPPPLLYRAATGQWEVWQDSDTTNMDGPADLPLGLLDDMNYGQRHVDVQRGDLALCYTDSLIESKHSDGSLLQVDGLLRLAAGLDVTDHQSLIRDLLQRIAVLHPDNLTEDDVTVLLIRPTGGSGVVPFRQRWEAPFRFLWGCGKALITGQRLPLPEFTWANLGGSLLDSLSRTSKHSRKAERQ